MQDKQIQDQVVILKEHELCAKNEERTKQELDKIKTENDGLH